MTTGADRFKRLDQYRPVKVLGIEIGTDSYREDQRTTRDCQQNGTVNRTGLSPTERDCHQRKVRFPYLEDRRVLRVADEVLLRDVNTVLPDQLPHLVFRGGERSTRRVECSKPSGPTASNCYGMQKTLHKSCCVG